MASKPRPARPASLPRRTGRQLWRAFGARHEPLARPLDRARARAWLLTLVGGLLAVAVSVIGSLLLYRSTAPQAAADRVRLHQVDAVVAGIPDHGAVTGSRFAGGYSNRIDVEAAWNYPTGTAHTGTVEAPRTAVAGAVVPIWVDPAGNTTNPPANRAALAVSAACTGAGALLAVLALLTLALRLRLRVLDRRAEAVWTTSWARLEPLWSGRAGHRRED
ncbi:Rv1733c family protein [Kitasatospora sp. NPDC001159]